MEKYRLAKFVWSRANSPWQDIWRSSLMLNYIIQNNQKQPPELFCKKRILKCFAKFTGKKVSGPAALLKRGLQHRRFLVNFAIFLRTLFCRTLLVALSENNEQQQLSWGFANNCYKIVLMILLQEWFCRLQTLKWNTFTCWRCNVSWSDMFSVEYGVMAWSKTNNYNL